MQTVVSPDESATVRRWRPKLRNELPNSRWTSLNLWFVAVRAALPRVPLHLLVTRPTTPTEIVKFLANENNPYLFDRHFRRSFRCCFIGPWVEVLVTLSSLDSRLASPAAHLDNNVFQLASVVHVGVRWKYQHNRFWISILQELNQLAYVHQIFRVD